MLDLLETPREGDRPPEVVIFRLATETPVQGDARWRMQLLDQVRADLSRRLGEKPEARFFEWGSFPLRIRADRLSGEYRRGGDIRLQWDSASVSTVLKTSQPDTALSPRTLPDETLLGLGERLVGLEACNESVLLHLRCRWDRQFDRWRELQTLSLSPAFRASLLDRVSLFVFAGDPGTGKSALAQVLADRYCREAGVSGTLLPLTTQSRGNGLVGDFSQRLRAAFSQALCLAAEGPCFLLLDEADALAVQRTETQAHQEDRAGTATLLQCLDEIRSGPPIAVFCTTNLLQSLDPALLRRGQVYRFERPDLAMRKALLRHWLPDLPAKTIQKAAAASAGMTPSDMERTLQQVVLAAIKAGAALSESPLLHAFRAGDRTREMGGEG